MLILYSAIPRDFYGIIIINYAMWTTPDLRVLSLHSTSHLVAGIKEEMKRLIKNQGYDKIHCKEDEDGFIVGLNVRWV